MAVFNILDYGAKPDGESLSTQAIQRAIDMCDLNGTVLIPRGTFVSGALFLKSNMTLELEEGARLKGSGSTDDYPIMTYSFEGAEKLCYASLINTEGAPHENITICGRGTIDANGRKLIFAELEENKGARGRAVCIRNTKGLAISKVVIRESPAWCLHLIYCEDVNVEDIEVHTKYDENGNKLDIYNGDGIDVDSCRKVRISNSLIASEDDGIAIKSGRDVLGRRMGIPSQDITIENCRFKGGFGVAVGSEMSAGAENVLVRNCSFEDTFSIASLKAIRGRGGAIRNIRYENCSLVNKDTEIKASKWFRGAIYIDAFYGKEEFDADTPLPADESTPIIENISFENLDVDTIEGYAVYLCGLPEQHYRNISFKNVRASGPEDLFVKNIDSLTMDETQIIRK